MTNPLDWQIMTSMTDMMGACQERELKENEPLYPSLIERNGEVSYSRKMRDCEKGAVSHWNDPVMYYKILSKKNPDEKNHIINDLQYFFPGVFLLNRKKNIKDQEYFFSDVFDYDGDCLFLKRQYWVAPKKVTKAYVAQKMAFFWGYSFSEIPVNIIDEIINPKKNVNYNLFLRHFYRLIKV